MLGLVTDKQHLLHGQYHVECGMQQECDQAAVILCTAAEAGMHSSKG